MKLVAEKKRKTMNKLIFEKEVYNIVGAAMEVHTELGPGFLEAVYHEALCIILDEKQIPFEQEKDIQICFKNQHLTKKYRADILCYNEIIVEIKAHSEITKYDIAQVINYLKATNCKLGVLINFGAHSLQYRRIIY